MPNMEINRYQRDDYKWPNMANFIFVKSLAEVRQKQHKSNLFRFWRIALNLMYYIGATPHKFMYCGNRGLWYKKTTKLHKILSILFAWIPFCLNEYSHLTEEFEEYFSQDKPSARAYFTLFNALFIKFMYILCFRALYFRPTQLAEMLNHIYKYRLLNQVSTMKTRNLGKRLLYIHVLIIFFGRFLLQSMSFVDVVILNKFKFGNPQANICDALVFRGKRRFHLEEICSNTFSDYFFGALECWIVSISRCMWTCMLIIYAVLFPVTLWITTQAFEDSFQSIDLQYEGKPKQMPVRMISQMFENLKDMSTSINEVWSTICLIWILHMSTKYAFNMTNAILLGSTIYIYAIVGAILDTLTWSVALFASGDVYCMMENFKGWLTEPNNWAKFKDQEDKDELRRILTNLDSAPVGIGESGVYKFTYMFIAQVFVVSITLFVVSFDN